MSFEIKALDGLYIITGDFWDRFCALRDPVEDPEIAFSGIGVSVLHCGNKSKEYKIELKQKILLKHLHQTVSQSTNVVHLKQVLWNCKGIFLDNAFLIIDISHSQTSFFMFFVYLSSLLQKTHTKAFSCCHHVLKINISDKINVYTQF